MSNATLQELYDRDFFEWTQAAAAALRASNDAALDTEHVAEEIESLGRSDLRGVESRLMQVLEHKLQLTLTRGIVLDRNRAKWTKSVDNQQIALARLLRDSPSLRARVPELIPENYATARRRFESEYQIGAPDVCHWDAREILGEK